MTRFLTWCYLVFLFVSAFVCYRRPIPDDFDHYMYEAMLRQRQESWEKVFSEMRSEYPRFRESNIADTAEHMAQLEPLYAIKPLYLATLGFLHRYLAFPPQNAIRFVSVLSWIVIGIILFRWTGEPLLCTAVMATQPMIQLARFGTPDALSSAFLLAGCYALACKRTALALTLVIGSIYVRTDNVIAVLLLLAWITVIEKHLTTVQGFIFAGIAVASVELINRVSGNYGWAVLFRHSFMTQSNVPAQIQPHVAIREYLGVVGAACFEIVTRFAPWLVLGISAWKCASRYYRWLLGILAVADATHFVLFPSAQDRYYAWTYAVTAVLFIESLKARGKSQDLETVTRSAA